MELKAIKREMIFTPEWRKNKEQPVASQVRVHFKKLVSSGEVGLYKRYAMNSGSMEMIYKDIELIVAHVDKIENLSIGKDKIDDGVKLCDYEDVRMHSLITEIRKHLVDDREDFEQGED